DHSAALEDGSLITLFQSVGAAPTPHILYLSHDSYFVLTGSSTVEIEFDMLLPSSQELSPILWEYWDGQGWHAYGDPDVAASTNPDTGNKSEPAVTQKPGTVQDGTNGLTRSGVVTLTADCVDTARTTVNAINAYWLRARLDLPLPPDLSRQDPLVRRIRVNTVIERLFDPDGLDKIINLSNLPSSAGVKPDQAFADGTSLDLSKAIYPFGQTPQPGSVFYFSSEEVFSKSNAVVHLALNMGSGALAGTIAAAPTVDWEYYDGRRWVPLSLSAVQDSSAANNSIKPDLTSSGVFAFTVPDQGIPVANVNGKDGRWVRARVKSGGYYQTKTIGLPSGSNPATMTITQTVVPWIADIRMAYVYRSPRTPPEHCLTYNDFTYSDHTDDVRWPGPGFAAFQSVSDTTPAVYFGFDKMLPVDLVSLYLDVEEQEGRPPGPPLMWEYWDGQTWREVAVQDDTARLVRPGMLGFIGPADGVLLARFDAPLYWLRGRLREDADPVQSTIDAIYVNAVWAIQADTFTNEPPWSGSGEPNATFFFTRKPVLEGEIVEVRELDGARAAVELPILAREVDAADLNITYDANGSIREVWVRWHGQPNLYLSGANDRHYVLERSSGRLIFGDGVNGRLLPAGTDNIRARVYRAGGGTAGNVPAGAITQLLGGIPYVAGVTNPRAAEGGADGETLDQIRVRGPQALRHRERALSIRDYESLAHEASPAVAVARALPTTHSSGRTETGWVKLIIVPNSDDPQPMPSFELRRQVQDFLLAHAPADLAGIFVTGPTYLPVGVAAVVAPIDASQAGPVGAAVGQALARFFHPLTGGPDGLGWPFGRAVYLSDVAAVLEALPGVDYVQELLLLLDGIVQGETVQVPPDRIVVAGPMRIRIRAHER
ncbi:MAG: putative baseplate assembly protein, partial [Rudaea sp.]